jgi:hypothetical protein
LLALLAFMWLLALTHYGVIITALLV